VDSLVFDVVGEFGVRDFGDRDLGTNDFLDGDEGFPAGDGDAPEKLVDFMEDWISSVVEASSPLRIKYLVIRRATGDAGSSATPFMIWPMLDDWGDTTSIDIGRASCPKKGSLFNVASPGLDCWTTILVRSVKLIGIASAPGSPASLRSSCSSIP
jgi:hypothetical protein